MNNNSVIDTLDFLYKNKICNCNEWSMTHAARIGNLDLVKWLHYNKGIRTEDHESFAVDMAASMGHLEIIQFLHSIGYKGREHCWGDGIIETAVLNGHLHVVKWAYLNIKVRYSYTILDNATYNGDLEMVKFLIENRSENDIKSAINIADEKQHNEIVEYLRSKL